MPRFLVTDTAGRIFGAIETVNEQLVEALITDEAHPNKAVMLELNKAIQGQRSAQTHKPKAKVQAGSAQEKVLEYVRGKKGITSKDVERDTGLGSGPITGALKHLCEKGLLTRYRVGGNSWKYDAV